MTSSAESHVDLGYDPGLPACLLITHDSGVFPSLCLGFPSREMGLMAVPASCCGHVDSVNVGKALSSAVGMRMLGGCSPSLLLETLVMQDHAGETQRPHVCPSYQLQATLGTSRLLVPEH